VNPTLWVTVLAAIGGPAGIVALIMILPQIKKLQADTSRVEKESEIADIEGASVLSAAALAQMQAAMARAAAGDLHIERLEKGHAEMRQRLDALEAQLRAYREVAQEHVAWDVLRIQDLVETHGVDPRTIPLAPPLLPPRG
jgi:t-SNARE complex subunit (syntaxin)